MSTSFRTSSLPLAKQFSEKYGKGLIGRTDLEDDALKRLHMLAQMATAEVLRVGHTIGEGVRIVREQVLAVDDGVASVDDRLADVNNKVAEVIDGA